MCYYNNIFLFDQHFGSWQGISKSDKAAVASYFKTHTEHKDFPFLTRDGKILDNQSVHHFGHSWSPQHELSIPLLPSSGQTLHLSNTANSQTSQEMSVSIRYFGSHLETVST